MHEASCGLPPSLDRRAFLALLATGTASALSACWSRSEASRPTGLVPPAPPAPTSTAPKPTLPPIPAARPGTPVVIRQGPPSLEQVALTVDDGSCEECVAGYVAFAERSGVQLTFCPNGRWPVWGQHADRLRPLIEAGQVQIANHTWSHPDLRRLSDKAVQAEIERNEDWIAHAFGVTARPWFRPPYGFRNHRIDALAGELGYTHLLLWNGTLGDATAISAQELLGEASRWVQAGAIVLGHANHPTVLGLFDQLQSLIAARGLRPVTLDSMFGTARASG